MAVLSGDSRFEEAYQEDGGGTNMCEYLDRVETRGLIKGTIATCLRFGMEAAQVLEEIKNQFKLDEATARKYLEEVG